MAHSSGSFDYKAIDPRIKQVLKSRSRLDNTVQVAMPFVKATTTVQLPKILGPGNIGFSIGLHAMDADLPMEDIFSAPRGSDEDIRSPRSTMPLIGHTHTPDGFVKPIYAIDATQEAAAKIFDRQASLYSSTNFVRVPPPGITSVNISRMKSGRVGQATLNIVVPSLVQLESLHRTFLIPGVGMVVEWGQQFSPQPFFNNDVGELDDITQFLFPWNNHVILKDLLNRLAVNKFGLKDILEQYVYPSKGQYMWMFGRVANFNIKGRGDGSFECTVKVVGPAEDSWAYSTKNTVVPAKDPSSQFFCANSTTSVYSFLTETVLGFNLKTLLDERIKDGNPWAKHIIKFKQSKTDGGEPQPSNTEQSNTSQKTFADSEDAYFMTWRFFVNVVLNDPKDGILGIFKKANLSSAELEKIGLLRPYAHGASRETTDVSNVLYVDDPLESFVGANKFLRSSDPSTLIIVNEKAVELAIANPQYNIATSAAETFKESPESRKMLAAGDFLLATSKGLEPYVTDQNNPDKGFLSTGVWLSHKAIIEAMTSADTVLRGISNLLERMNQATSGYWKLSLDVADGDAVQNLGQNYSIVDSNSRESSDKAVDKFINSVHVFNKYARVDKETDKLVGSELIESSVELNLPKLLFSQIATMGLVHPEDAKNAGVDTDAPKSPKLLADDRLRKMFAVTSLATTEDGQALADTEQGPDLTILPKKERRELIAASTCGATNTNTTAQTSGEGNKAGNVPINEDYKDKSVEDLKSEQEKAKDELNSEKCKACQSCKTIPVPPSPESPQVVDQVVQPSAIPGGTMTSGICATLSEANERFACSYAFNKGITNSVEMAQFLAQCKQESLFRNPPVENLNYSAGRLKAVFPAKFPGDTAKEYGGQPQKIANYVYGRADLGNTTPGDGWKYRGRGFMQITGKANYQAYAQRSGKDVVNNPDLMTTDLNIAADSAVDYWIARVRKNTSNFSDTYNVTRYINAARLEWKKRDANFRGYLQKFNRGIPVPAPVPVAPSRSSTAATAPTGFAAVFVSGITGSLSAAGQAAAFKQGVGQDKRVFSAEYTQLSQVKNFLRNNPKTPVFLYSKAGEFVSQFIDDPNVDKQKLFLIEPYLAGDGTYASVQRAVGRGLPAANIYGGPDAPRGGGNRRIPGSSVTPVQYTHFQAPTYVGQQKASILSSTAQTTPAQSTTSTQASSLFPSDAVCYGDSIAVGYCGKRPGQRVVGNAPGVILGYLKSDVAQYRGKNVILSTGVSNGPTQFRDIEEQFKILKANNAVVTVIGAAAGRFDAENKRLQTLTAQYGFRFLGPFIPTPADGVHPRTYAKYESPAGSAPSGPVPIPPVPTPTTTTTIQTPPVVNKTVVPPQPVQPAAIGTGKGRDWRYQPIYPWGNKGHVGAMDDLVLNPATGKKRVPAPPYLAGRYENAYIPWKTPGILVPTNRHPLGKNDSCAGGRYGGCLLIPEAAAQLELLREAAKNAGYTFYITSAYRDYAQQKGTKDSSKSQAGGVASPGSSPHGWAVAIDIGELIGDATKNTERLGLTDNTLPPPNYICRTSGKYHKLFQWLADYAPLYGWYNPQRLWDDQGAEECWHFEYWGWKYPPKIRSANQIPTVPPTYAPGTPPGAPPPAPGEVPPDGQAPLPVPVSQNSSICTDEEYLRISTENSLLGSTFASVADGKKMCDECRRYDAIANQLQTVVAEKEKFESRTREFAGYEQVFRYIEIFPEYMIASITDDADGNRSNAFGASPGTLSISTDLVMPGINGIRVGELFWIDRMPAFYRAFGAFQIMNIEDTISVTDGWKTKVHAVFNYMGEAWKSRMSSLLASG